MENKGFNTWVTFEETEDELSFSNFTMLDNKESSALQSPRDSVAEDSFEFITDLSPAGAFSAPAVVFCGKIMNDHDQEELNKYQKRDYLTTVRSKSSRRTASCEYPILNYENTDHSLRKNGSISLRFSTSQSPKYSASNVHNVNITSLTSMSATSRRRMFMFGPVKFKPEMELSAIKERQGRRVPTTMFPASSAADGKKTVASGGGEKAGAGGKNGHWRMMRSLMGRAHLTDLLNKSFGCIALPRGENG